MMNKPKLFHFIVHPILILATVAFTACAPKEEKSTITQRFYDTTPQGQSVHIFALQNTQGSRAFIINYGAILTGLAVPDREGTMADVVLGFNNLYDYIEKNQYFGSTVGRFANRIAGGKFSIDGKVYQLETDGSGNNLHSAPIGFDKVIWNAEPILKNNTASLKLTYTSPDGQNGFPGNLTTTVTYTLTNDNALRIDYEATSDKTTPVNLTHHSYFNLLGDGMGNVYKHSIQVNAANYTPDIGGIPTGEIASVKDTAFDLTSPKQMGEAMEHKDLEASRGYNHNFVLDNQSGDLALAATLSEPFLGRVMEVWTTEPGLHLYAGNWLSKEITGKSRIPYMPHGGVCLETQHYPDSPNHSNFPNTLLHPGEVFNSTTIYKFSVSAD